jgi:tRNA-specific 2-thiouridylase
MPERVVVCMSGGVDSTVAALRLKEEGHDVSGLTFSFWTFAGAPDDARRAERHTADAAAAAAREVGIPHETIDATDAFQKTVLRDYVERYRAGQTPNPCGRCNRFLRFGLALDYARENGFGAVATGHHVRVGRAPDGTRALFRGRDPNKDQTYFLYGLAQAELTRLRFPVGELTKKQVVEAAWRSGLTCADQPESQDLCFALDGNTSFLFEERDFKPGPIVDREGRVIGTHRGLPNYTVGQRRGLGLPSARPLYVIGIDAAANRLIVGDEQALAGRRLVASDVNYISGHAPEDGARLDAKIRYRSPASPARFTSLPVGRFSLAFEVPRRAITAGQIAALYDGDRLLGGGTIEPSVEGG